MKPNRFLISILPLLLLCQIATAQKKWAIKTNLPNLYFKAGTLQLELMTDTSQSINFGVHYAQFNLNGASYSGIGFVSEYRIYLSNQTLNGLYLGPFVRFQKFDINKIYYLYDTRNRTTTSYKSELELIRYGGGIVLGYQWFSRKGLLLDIYSGLDVNINDYRYPSSNVNQARFTDLHPYFEYGVLVKAGISIGIGQNK